MFSSPSLRFVPSNENVDNMIQRKQGDVNHLSRKPFIDRSVNSKTPDIGRSAKDKFNVFRDSNLSLKKTIFHSEKKVVPKLDLINDLDAADFIFSGNNLYDDLGCKYIDRKKIRNVLVRFCQLEDTYPSLTSTSKSGIDSVDVDYFDIDPMFLELPKQFGQENVSEVEIPTCEDDDLNISMRTL